MAMAGFEWKDERPFKAVYFTGMVRDKQRRKMSKLSRPKFAQTGQEKLPEVSL